MLLDDVKDLLKDRKINVVAKGTGLHSNTVYKISKGKTIPHTSTLEKLYKYLKG